MITEIRPGRFRVQLDTIGSPTTWEFEARDMAEAEQRVKQQVELLQKKRQRNGKVGRQPFLVNPGRKVHPRF